MNNANRAVGREQRHPVAVTPAKQHADADTIVQQDSLDVEDHRKKPARGIGVLSEAADLVG